MGFRDLLLFYVVTGFSIRWVAAAAAAGPSALVVWALACAAFYVPLVLCVLELSSRYPEEGGLYVWSKRAFGEFSGFITGWTYWACNLPFFAGLLYFTAANALYVGGHRWEHLAGSAPYFVAASLAGLALAAGLNVVGLNVGKWLHNAGAIGFWVPALLLLVAGAAAWRQFGVATEFSAASFAPGTRLKDVIFWSTIAFSLSGAESASVLGGEIRDPRRNIPRALLAAGAIITSLYVLATASVLVALPRSEVLGMQGIMQAITRVGERAAAGWIAPVAAALIVVGGVGQAGAWFAASSRLPFVAGVDRLLPAAFGRLHPRWGTPYVALLVQAAAAALFVVLGQAGASVKGAYDVLVSMSIIAYFIPYLFMFAAMIRLQREPAGPGVTRVPGGKPAAVVLAAVGFTTTALSIGLAAVPADGEANEALAVTKVVGLTALLVAVGVVIYAAAAVRRQAPERPAARAAPPEDG